MRTGGALGMAVIATLFAALGVPVARAAGEPNGWVEVAPSLISRSEVAAAGAGRFLYVVGGIAYPLARPGAVERYDTTRDSWRLEAPLPEDVNHAAAAVYRGDVYVVGGYRGFPENGPLHGLSGDETGRFFRYSPAKDSWTELAPMPTSRGALGAAVIGDRLYAVGGYSAALGTVARLEIYDFGARHWTQGPDMSQPREHLGVAALDGALYVFGGRDFYGGQTYATGERFVPALGRWEKLPPMRVSHAGFQAVAANGRLVVFGGEQAGAGVSGTIGDVEAFDPRRQTWSTLASMPDPRHGLGGAWDGHRVYALEGGEETLLGGSTVAEALTIAAERRAPAAPLPRPRPSLLLTVRPDRVAAGEPVLLRLTVTARFAGRRRPIANAVVRLLRWTARTDRRGTATLRGALERPGILRVRVTRPGFRAGTAIVRVVARPARPAQGRAPSDADDASRP